MIGTGLSLLFSEQDQNRHWQKSWQKSNHAVCPGTPVSKNALYFRGLKWLGDLDSNQD
jgi:hypothetical protein